MIFTTLPLKGVFEVHIVNNRHGTQGNIMAKVIKYMAILYDIHPVYGTHKGGYSGQTIIAIEASKNNSCFADLHIV